MQVTFDPRQISLGKILQIYFSVAHNPTELNYQGPDVGAQYRSEIFYANDEQKRVAEAYIAQLNTAHVFAEVIVTKVGALPGFNPAAGSDQDFAVLHPDQAYIVSNDLPKVANLKRLFPDYYRETPVTVLASNNAHRVTTRGRSAQERGRRSDARKAARAPSTRLRSISGGVVLSYGPDKNQGSDQVFFTIMQADGSFKPVVRLIKMAGQ